MSHKTFKVRRAFARHGFTLVEFIIYIGLAIIVLAAVSELNFSLQSQMTRSATRFAVQRDHELIMNSVAQEVHAARDISLSQTRFGVPYGKLVLTMDDPDRNPTIFEVVPRGSYYDMSFKAGPGPARMLTSDKVSIDSFVIKNLSAPDGSTKNIQVALQLHHVNTGNLKEYEQTVSATTTLELLNAQIMCGNGFTEPGEECDDGNAIDIDACTSLCAVNLSPSWWDASWQHRKLLTIDTGSITQPLAEFPLLVKLDGSFDYSKTLSGGRDIRFVDEDDATVLAYEIEAWQDAQNESFVWVKVPEIKASPQSDAIYMYYNNPAATDASNPAGVWNPHYRAVWHMKQAAPVDATGRSLRTCTAGTNSITPGHIDGANLFSGGVNDHITCTQTATTMTDKITVSAWIRWSGLGATTQEITGNAYYGASFKAFRNFGNRVSFNIKYSFVYSDGPLADGLWHHVVGTYDQNLASDNIKLYIDGVLQADTANEITAIPQNFGLWYMSYTSFSSSAYSGSLDEIQVSSVPRSVDWIRAQYDNQKASSSFISFGAEESP